MGESKGLVAVSSMSAFYESSMAPMPEAFAIFSNLLVYSMGLTSASSEVGLEHPAI